MILVHGGDNMSEHQTLPLPPGELEIKPSEENRPPVKEEADSILTSVKKLLGIQEDNEVFDLEIMMNINTAITILTQIGIGPSDGYVVTSKEDTYEMWLGDMTQLHSVKLYLYYRTRLSFDPPTQGSVMTAIQDQIKELEWRLNVQVDPIETFQEDEEVIEND